MECHDVAAPVVLGALGCSDTAVTLGVVEDKEQVAYSVLTLDEVAVVAIQILEEKHHCTVKKQLFHVQPNKRRHPYSSSVAHCFLLAVSDRQLHSCLFFWA